MVCLYYVLFGSIQLHSTPFDIIRPYPTPVASSRLHSVPFDTSRLRPVPSGSVRVRLLEVFEQVETPLVGGRRFEVDVATPPGARVCRYPDDAN